MNTLHSQSFYIPAGTVIADYLAVTGRFTAMPCGGKGICGKCRAIIKGTVTPATNVELSTLTPAQLAAGYRLLCQARSTGGEVHLSNMPDSAEISILTDADVKIPKEDRPTISLSTATEHYGIAFDVGTTTLVGYLVNLSTGRIVGVQAQANPQAMYGADVMSRIAFASTPTGLHTLHTQIIAALTHMAHQLINTYDVNEDQVTALSAVGNTCMHHLLLNLSPVSLGQAPYLPVQKEALHCTTAEVGFTSFTEATLWVGPIIGGFVGADAVAAASASLLRRDKQVRLLVDLGTNGEILLAAGDRLLACSAAAGPAFEGVNISCGMRAEPGAIFAVNINNNVTWQVIGGETIPPKGLCGTGLVDALAELIRTGLVDNSGRLLDADHARSKVSTTVAARLVPTERGLAFRLYEDDGVAVDITQADIRQVQLAKAAIRAAIEVLCLELNITPADITEVILAGAFGNFVQPKNVLRLGLLPPIPPERIRSIGNASGAGAVLALTSPRAIAECTLIASMAEHIELETNPCFQDRFISAMGLPFS